MDHEAKIEPIGLSGEETTLPAPEKQNDVEVEETETLVQSAPVEELEAGEESESDEVVVAEKQEEIKGEEGAATDELAGREETGGAPIEEIADTLEERAEIEDEGAGDRQEGGDALENQDVGVINEQEDREEIQSEEASVVEKQEDIVKVEDEAEDRVGVQAIVEGTEHVEGAEGEAGSVVEKQEVASVAVVPPAPAKGGRRRRLHPVLSAFLLFLTIVIGGGGVIAASYYYNSVRQPLSTFVRPVEREPTPGMTPTSGYESIQGRSWNLLLLGSDDDAKFVFPVLITQVMMIVRVDTVSKTVTMVSIPRDSWVYVPEVGGMHKIGQAFFLGALTHNNSFEGGVRLARMTVERNYGVPIDRYAWVGLSGFAKVIDRLGGVDVDVIHPLVDDTYPDDVGNVDDPNNPYGHKRIYIAPGPQRLTGHEALEYVRSRHSDLIGDIGRTHRQQQILEALKLKLNVGNIIGRLPELLEDLTGSVYTDLSEDEMIALAYFGRELDSNSIKRVTLGFSDGEQNYGQGTTLYDPWAGAYQYAILPNCEAIEPVMNQIFGLGDANSCNVRG